MGIMDKLFHKGENEAKSEPVAADLTTCPHTTMTPRWDSADDIGHYDRATGFRCEGCGQSFTPDEERQLRASASERLAEALPPQ